MKSQKCRFRCFSIAGIQIKILKIENLIELSQSRPSVNKICLDMGIEYTGNNVVNIKKTGEKQKIQQQRNLIICAAAECQHAAKKLS